MTLQQLRYLCEVVRCELNISRAAQALGMSQPGLSRQLQVLEEELGVALFLRNSRRLVGLSEAGQDVASLAGRMLEDEENILAAARDHSDRRRGKLTIATTHTQARYALPPVLREFGAQYPEVRISLRQGTPTEVAELVRGGAADIAIAAESVQPVAGLVHLPAYELHRVLLVPARHPLLRVRPLALEDLAGYPLITYDFAFIARSKIVRAFEKRGLTPNVVLNAIDADVIKAYVEFGLGIAVLPALAFDPKRDKTLRAIDARHLFEPNTIQVTIRQNHLLRSYAYSFIEMFAPALTRVRVEKALRGVMSRRRVIPPQAA